MKGLIGGGMGVGSLETTKPKSVTAEIWWRGQWDIIRLGWDEWEFEIEIEEDAVVYCSEVLELKLGGLCSEPLKKGNLIIVEVGLLKDIEVPLSLLFVSWRVVDMAGNGGLT